MKPYLKYKDSGIEWIGEIPEHWEVKKLKYFSKIVNGSTPQSGNGEYWGGEIVWVTPNDLGKLKGNQITDSLKKITQRGLNNCGTTLTPKNSIILYTRAPIGHIGITDIRTCTNQGCKTIVHDSSKCDNKFLFYYLFSSKNTLQSLGQGSTFIELSSQNLKDFQNPVPLFHEQQTIANYLDRKTHRIDTFIEKKQRRIDLLKEQRSAIINQAVTKGLNPNVKLKDSDIEWLGEIPEHWEVKKLKYVITIKSGEGITREDIKEEGTYEVYGGNGFLGFTEDYNVTNDTLIIGRVGAKCGNVHLVCGHKWVTDNALIAKTNQNYRFLFFLLTSMRLNNLANQNAQPLITGTMIKYQIAALPTIDEQDKIVENIESETMRFDTRLRNNQRQIDLLKEYRTALISEVVTGKIDVRDYGEQEVISS